MRLLTLFGKRVIQIGGGNRKVMASMQIFLALLFMHVSFSLPISDCLVNKRFPDLYGWANHLLQKRGN